MGYLVQLGLDPAVVDSYGRRGKEYVVQHVSSVQVKEGGEE